MLGEVFHELLFCVVEKLQFAEVVSKMYMPFDDGSGEISYLIPAYSSVFFDLPSPIELQVGDQSANRVGRSWLILSPESMPPWCSEVGLEYERETS